MSLSLYTSHLDAGLLARLTDSPSEYSHRSIGRPPTEQVREAPGIRVIWPWTTHGRARKVLSRSGARRRYVVPCLRGGDRDAHCEAREEAFAAILLDACAPVQFQEQPATIEYEWRGAHEVHFPDYLVAYCSQVEFWECKRDAEVVDLYVRRRTERLQELLRPLGIAYRLVSTSQLLRAAYYRNAIELRRHARAILSHPEWAHAVTAGGKALPAGELLGCVPQASRLSALAALLYHRVLEGDLALPIDLAMPVHSPANHKGENPWVLELFNQGN